jgi:hypothetical protein
MFGDGDMILAGNDAIEKNDNAAGSNTTNGNQNDDMGQQRAISFDDDEPMSYRSTPKSAQRITTPSMSETIQNIMRSNSASRMPQRGSSSSDGRSVVNIVVFYNDGRFEQFGPLK